MASVSPVQAADPAFVGVLSLAVEEDGARQLGLSEEVRETLRQLVGRRENEAISLALSIKDLPPELRTERLAPFVAESERLGMELLTQEQRSKLNQLRLRRAGMVSLAEPEMGQLLGLAPEQQSEITRLLTERSRAMAGVTQAQQRVARDKFERQLRGLLTAAQRATWDQMAGLGPGPAEPVAAQPPMDAVTEAAEVADALPPDATLAESPTESAAHGDPIVEGLPEGGAAADSSTVTDAATPDTATPEAATPPAADEQGEGGEDGQPQLLPDAPQVAAPQPEVSELDETVPPGQEVDDMLATPENVKLRFNFRFQPW